MSKRYDSATLKKTVELYTEEVTERMSHGVMLQLGADVPQRIRDRIIALNIPQSDEDTWGWDTMDDDHALDLVGDIVQVLTDEDYILLNRNRVCVFDEGWGIEWIWVNDEGCREGVYFFDLMKHGREIVSLAIFDV